MVLKQQGIFISVEGIDGSGKSTHLPFIQDYFIKLGYDVIVTREPGGTVVGEQIRNILLHSEELHDNSELLLYFASRQELIHNVILPSLNSGKCVIADRFIDSSIVYQGVGRNLGIDKVKQLSSMLNPLVIPKLTMLFDASLDVAIKRLKTERQLDRIEQQPVEFFRKIQQAYYHLLNENSERIKLVSTNVSIAETQVIIKMYLDQFIQNDA